MPETSIQRRTATILNQWNSIRRSRHIADRVLAFLFPVILIATVAAGMWPLHAPRNDVTWAPDRHAIHIGANGTALSSAAQRLNTAVSPSCSIEMWVEPERTWGSGA